MKKIIKSAKDNTLFTIDTYRDLGSMERVLFILLVVLLKVPQVFCDNLSMRVRYLISPLALKLAAFVLKVTIRLSCRVSSAMLTYRAVQLGIQLHSFLTKNHHQYYTSCSEISWKRGEGLAPLLMYKLETSTRKLRSELRSH